MKRNQLIPTTDFYSQASQLSQSRLEQIRAQSSFNMGYNGEGNGFINPEILNIKVKEPLIIKPATTTQFVPIPLRHKVADGNTALYDIRSSSLDDARKMNLLQRTIEKGKSSDRAAMRFTNDERMDRVITRPHETTKYASAQMKLDLKRKFDESDYLKQQRRLVNEAYRYAHGKGVGGENRYGISNIIRNDISLERSTPEFRLNDMNTGNFRVSTSEVNNVSEQHTINTDASNYTRNVPNVQLKSSNINSVKANTKTSIMGEPGLRNKTRNMNLDKHVVFSEDTPREQFNPASVRHIQKGVNDAVDRVARDKISARVNNRYVETDDSEMTRINSMRDRIHFMVPVKETYEDASKKSILDRIADTISGFFNRNKTDVQKRITENYTEDIMMETDNVNMLTGDQDVLETNEVYASRMQVNNSTITKDAILKLFNENLRRDFVNNQTQQIIKTVVEPCEPGTPLEGFDMYQTLVYDKSSGGYVLMQTLRMRNNNVRMQNGMLTDESIKEYIETDQIVRRISLTEDLVKELGLNSDVDIHEVQKLLSQRGKLTDEMIKDDLIRNISVYVDIHQDTDERIKILDQRGKLQREQITDELLQDFKHKLLQREDTDVYSAEVINQREGFRRMGVTRDSMNTQKIGAQEGNGVKGFRNIRFGQR